MLSKREHLQQNYAMLMLREIRELRENETALLSSLRRIESELSRRNCRDVPPVKSDYNISVPTAPETVVAEPVASLVGVSGSTDSENIKSDDGTVRSAPGDPPTL